MTEIKVYYTESGEDSDLLLRRAASLYTGLDAAEFVTFRERGRKPVFVLHPKLHASVSHSGGVWAAAFSDTRPVGMDIQERMEVRRYESIARRYYHPKEADAVLSSADPMAEFCHIWCRKEAAVKQSGRGIDGSFAKFDSTENPAEVFGKRLVLTEFEIPSHPEMFGIVAFPGEITVTPVFME